MRFLRRYFPAVMLALYLLQVVGAKPLHIWECSEGSASCEAVGNTSSHLHADCQHPLPTTESEERDGSGHTPQHHHEHDSSSCWVCDVLGQAQSHSSEVTVDLPFTVAPAFVVAEADFLPAPSPYGFQSRAPPIALG